MNEWFGHLMRMPVDSAPVRAYNTRSNSKKPRGRPRRRWADDIKYICASLLNCDIRAATSRARTGTLYFPLHQTV